MRTIGVVTVGRSDFGIYLPILRAIRANSRLKLALFVSGMHCSPEFGSTWRMIESEGFEITERIEMLLSSDSPEGIAKSMGLGAAGFSQAYSRSRPDILVVLGDRFEMHSAAIAAVPFKIPIAHIHGGELTQGAIDDVFRHSITKLSHLHFAAAEEYARRIRQMGEEDWRITVCGAPGLDHLRTLEWIDAKELTDKFGLDLSKPPLLVTFHPVSLEFDQAGRQTESLLDALAQTGLSMVFTLPNADTGGRVVIKKIEEFCRNNPHAMKVDNLGTRAYFSLMKHSAAMVGNSSSGIIEAGSLKLPVVNVGNRQKGRVRGPNVLDADCQTDAILATVRRAVSAEFGKSLSGMKNPYDAGVEASKIIVDKLAGVAVDDRLLIKQFADMPPGKSI